MYKHLKSRQEYIDFYDRLTVTSCRVFENRLIESFKAGLEEARDKKDIDEYKRMALWAIDLSLLFKRGEEWENKEKIIREWTERDEERDRKLNEAKPIKGVKCLKCGAEMECDLIDLDVRTDDDPEKVMLWYKCMNKCKKGRVFFENGDEHFPKLNCSKCGGEQKSEHKREGKIINSKYICDKCGYTETDIIDLSEKPKKKDTNFDKDRQRFVMSNEEGQKYIATKHQMENIKNFMEEMKEKDKNKDLYDKLKGLKKLKVPELKELPSKELEKDKYISLEFNTPEIGKEVIINFSVQDNKNGREDKASEYDLKKLIKKTLINTNWVLMSGGLIYRLGVLTGRLKGFENEDDLLNLIKK